MHFLRFFFLGLLVLLPLSHAFAANTQQPSILWMANAPAEPAKARLLQKIAKTHQINLKTHVYHRTRPRECGC